MKNLCQLCIAASARKTQMLRWVAAALASSAQHDNVDGIPLAPPLGEPADFDTVARGLRPLTKKNERKDIFGLGTSVGFACRFVSFLVILITHIFSLEIFEHLSCCDKRGHRQL